MTHIGFWLISLAITSFFVFVFGFEMETKDKVLMIIGFQAFIGILEMGLYLMGIN